MNGCSNPVIARGADRYINKHWVEGRIKAEPGNFAVGMDWFKIVDRLGKFS